jgi:hypothetical protein
MCYSLWVVNERAKKMVRYPLKGVQATIHGDDENGYIVYLYDLDCDFHYQPRGCTTRAEAEAIKKTWDQFPAHKGEKNDRDQALKDFIGEA